MPRFNDSGQVTPQIGFYWFDQERFIFQDCSSGVCDVRLSDGTLIAPFPVHSLLGNGHGVWAFVEHVAGATDPTQIPYHDSFGRKLPNTFQADIGPEGNIAVKPHSNFGTAVLEPDGSSWTLPDNALEIQLLTGKRAKWTEGGVVHANFPLIGNPNVPVWGSHVASDGALLYQRQSDGALILGGKIIGPPSDKYFNPAVLLIGDTYHVVWALTTADIPVAPLKISKATLATMPDAGLVTIPGPIIVDPVEPPKEPPVPSFPNHKPTIEHIRAKYPTPLGGHHWEFLVEVAQTLKAKLFRKDGGDRVHIPQINMNVSQDIIILDGWWVDILGDAENTATPEWSPHPNAAEGDKWIDVSSVLLPRDPDPRPEPTPLPILESRIAELEKTVGGIKIAVEAFMGQTHGTLGQIQQLAEDLSKTVEELENKPLPSFRAKGRTSKTALHVHDIDIEVVPVDHN